MFNTPVLAIVAFLALLGPQAFHLNKLQGRHVPNKFVQNKTKMVFVTKPTPPIEVVQPPFTEKPANVLQFSAQYHMVGLISSLGEVSNYATELFNSLLQETSKLNSRMVSVGQRISNLQRSSIDDTLKKTPVTSFLETPRSNYALEPVQVR